MIELGSNIILVLKTVFIDWSWMTIKAVFDFMISLF